MTFKEIYEIIGEQGCLPQVGEDQSGHLTRACTLYAWRGSRRETLGSVEQITELSEEALLNKLAEGESSATEQ